MNRLNLYLVTDSSFLCGRKLEDVVMEAVAGGVTMVQLREKSLSTNEFIALAFKLKSCLQAVNVPLIINDRIDVALAVDADGVHIGQSDMPYDMARRLLGKDKIIGLSVESFSDIERANTLDVDYIGVSPVFATPTKTDTSRPFGIDGLRKAVEMSVHPTVGIGGMNLSTAAEVMATGTDGIAVVSAIMGADNPREAAAELALKVSSSRFQVSGSRFQDQSSSKNGGEKDNLRTSEPQNLKTSKPYPKVLTIAGSDSGGGAGIQADIKAISATGAYAASAITAVTVQNTLGVESVLPVPTDVVAAQIKSVLSDIGTDAIKIGMLHDASLVRVVAESIEAYLQSLPNGRGTVAARFNIVLDPVMVSTSGHRLIEVSAVQTLKEILIPMARVITPNIPEAEMLLETKIACQSDLYKSARRLSFGGKVSVMMKAGHLSDADVVDVFYNAETDEVIELKSKRVSSCNTHGTGCTLSSAFASYLAQGFDLNDAAKAAKEYVSKAIESAKNLKIGNGHGPVDHFFMLNRS